MVIAVFCKFSNTCGCMNPPDPTDAATKMVDALSNHSSSGSWMIPTTNGSSEYIVPAAATPRPSCYDGVQVGRAEAPAKSQGPLYSYPMWRSKAHGNQKAPSKPSDPFIDRLRRFTGRSSTTTCETHTTNQLPV